MMKVKNNLVKALALLVVAPVAAAAPVAANAQSLNDLINRRQSKKNEWRNLAYAGAALAGLGLIQKNNTLVLAGVGGGLYSAWRYEQDRKSQSSMARRRAQLYSRSSVVVDGKRYRRKTVWKNGKRYYTFVRG